MAAIPPDGATASHEATRPASKDVAVGVPGRRTQRSDTWHWQAPRRNQPHDTPGRGELLGPDEEKGTGREEIRQPAAGQPGPALCDCVMTDTTAPISREESTAGVVREGETGWLLGTCHADRRRRRRSYRWYPGRDGARSAGVAVAKRQTSSGSCQMRLPLFVFAHIYGVPGLQNSGDSFARRNVSVCPRSPVGCGCEPYEQVGLTHT